ncbi:MAG: HD domain-containing protein [Betaproteobacteria bacterium]|nr:HD domain-containing protein [Betaproteobacteria bacterium]
MTSDQEIRIEPSIPELVQQLEPRLPSLDRRELADATAPLLARLQERLSPSESGPVSDLILSLCRRLYDHARSGDALPLARALLAQAILTDDGALERRASSTCGLLAADTADIVGAIDYQCRTLALSRAEGSRIDQGRTWNNIGLAFLVAGNYELAVTCYHRAIAMVEDEPGPVYGRYTSFLNLAHALYQIGEFDEGLRFGSLALEAATPSFTERDPYAAILLRRNVVRLLIATGRVAEAGSHLPVVAALVERFRTPRAQVAAATTRAAWELATGHVDIALTRLDEALGRARQVPSALHDTLSYVARAEEAAGNTERALLRLHELSEHVYRLAINRARQHLDLSSLFDAPGRGADHAQEQARARLVSHLRPPGEPEDWKALQRLAIAAALRMDSTGWHGLRVGALAKALALASGCVPLEALEIGLAAELHDIGLASVPEAIFSKQGTMNDVERRLFEKHTDAGAEILRDDRHPRILMAREIAKYHHARWDGTGYPARVGGRFIPLPARICAVADAYDEMVCGLCGGPAITMDQALEKLQSGSGTRFDPELVTCFVSVIRDETADRGIDPSTTAGLESFQELVLSLQEDRGFL